MQCLKEKKTFISINDKYMEIKIIENRESIQIIIIFYKNY